VDDGAGFDADAFRGQGDPRRIGIAGMRERAALIDGEFTIESVPGQGTTVRIKVPLAN
jgi:signal transduction histidine kinase